MAASGPNTGRTASGAAIRPRSRLYVSTVIALAAVLSVITLGRWNTDRFVATARLSAHSKSPDKPWQNRSELQQSIESGLQIRQAIDELAKDGISIPGHLDAIAIRRRLTLYSDVGRATDSAKFSLTYTGSDPTVAVALVNRISNLFQNQQSKQRGLISVPAYRNEYSTAARDAKQAELGFRQAKAALDAFYTQNLDKLQSVLDSNSDPAANQSPPQETPAIDPPVDNLVTRIATIQFKLDEMSKNGKDDGPEFAELEAEVERLKIQLEATKLYASETGNTKDDGETTTIPRYELAALYNDHEQNRSAAETQRILDEYRSLQVQVAAARQEHTIAQRIEQQQWEQKFDVKPTVEWRVEPAVTARRQFTPIAPPMFVLAATFGLITASSVAMSYSSTATIRSAAGAQAIFSVPVTGTIREADDLPAPSGPPRPWLIRVATSAGELVMAGMLLAMILATLLDEQFAAHLRHDPLAGLTDGVRRIVEIAWS